MIALESAWTRSVVTALALWLGTQAGAGARQAKLASPDPAGPVFTDVTSAAGIRFRHNNGAFGKKYLPETLGSGCAFLDYDGDGWQDILLINSKNFPGRPGTPSFPALYRNHGNGTFSDVTKQAGLA